MSEQETNNDQAENENRVTNADIKNSDLFKKVASQLGELKEQLAEKQATEELAAKAAEEKKLLDQQKYDELLGQKTDEYESRIKDLENKVLEKDLVVEMQSAGFKNKTFLRGAISDYDPGGGQSVEDYVKGLAEDPLNAPFLGAATKAKPKREDVVVPSGSFKAMSPDELKMKLNSKDPGERASAREYAKEQFLKTGSTGLN